MKLFPLKTTLTGASSRNSNLIIRGLATKASDPQLNVFDRTAKLLQRNRAGTVDIEEGRKVEYLRDEIAIRTIERMAFITRDMTNLLDFGSNLGNLLKNLCIPSTIPPNASTEVMDQINQLNDDKLLIKSKIKNYYMYDSSEAMLNRDIEQPYWNEFQGNIHRCLGDEEVFSGGAFRENYYDAVVSNLSMHWINNLPQALSNINKVLKPDGVFMGTLFGGDTLYELRTSLQLAELERMGGLSPRVSPLVQLNDIGSLLNRAGFTMLTIDPQDIVVGGFPDIVAVCNDLQLMGEQNLVLSRSNYLSRDMLLSANEIYKTLHGEKDVNNNVTLPATFSVMFVIGWKNSPDQPQPLERGSGEMNLKDVL